LPTTDERAEWRADYAANRDVAAGWAFRCQVLLDALDTLTHERDHWRAQMDLAAGAVDTLRAIGRELRPDLPASAEWRDEWRGE
jgi:hypothetical protein